jgi:hypothetical protein
MGLVHRNIHADMDKDLDPGEKLLKLTTNKAFGKLMEGREVFAKFETIEHQHVKGCRKCNISRKGKFCHECGSQITDKLPIGVVKDTRWIGLSMEWKENCSSDFRDDERELMECSNHPHSGGRHWKKASMQLGYFVDTKIWYWRGY